MFLGNIAQHDVAAAVVVGFVDADAPAVVVAAAVVGVVDGDNVVVDLLLVLHLVVDIVVADLVDVALLLVLVDAAADVPVVAADFDESTPTA